MDTKQPPESMLSDLEYNSFTCTVGISELNGVVERYDKSLSELANVVSS